jgi:hypothetical protein
MEPPPNKNIPPHGGYRSQNPRLRSGRSCVSSRTSFSQIFRQHFPHQIITTWLPPNLPKLLEFSGAIEHDPMYQLESFSITHT